ncbi:MAG: DEAD/DEAH box helicase [Planctomycetes bacterium]|nr:DEAD/DEAH box helicase [Planctomycetota bacterium]
MPHDGAMDVRQFLHDITTAGSYRDQIATLRTFEPREARYAAPSKPLPDGLASLLRRQNIHRLYTHQAAALDAAAECRDVVVVTATASGKTLCYNLPVVRTLLAEPNARAMYVFPTKALTQDQYGTLKRWAADEAVGPALRPAVYDGDTPTHNRSTIRRDANLILTNPDMLHVGMLPYHAKWHAMLANLRYLVVDELHTCRGIFGSHVACVLRRLLRLCEHYGSRPQIICSSATIANPVELARRLTGRDVTLVDDDGAPQGRKHVVLWNPPLLDDEQLSRRSANVEAVDLVTELVRRRAQSIVFGKARVVVELIYRYAKQRLADAGQDDLAARIRPYRGGYLPGERREIEQMLFSGKLLAVTATNALELGIDVGALDAAVLVGYPGTICSTWQQAGRAGRASQDSLVILIAYNDPVDQYVCRNPAYLFGASHEYGVIDPENPHILQKQLACACFEKPLTPDDAAYFGDLTGRIAGLLSEDGQGRQIDERLYYSSSEMPHRTTNLRTISDDSYSIVDVSGSNGEVDAPGARVIGQVDSISAPELVYPNAIYLHEGDSYTVRDLDGEAKIATVTPAEVDYYTQPVLANACRLDLPIEEKPAPGGRANVGPADVTWQTTAFQKVRYYTMEVIGQMELDLPSQTLPTVAFWWTPQEDLVAALGRLGLNPIEAMMGLRNLLVATLPALAMCDRRDISGKVESRNLGRPNLVVYDRYPGGLGFCQQGYERVEQWLAMAKELVADCPCSHGCPSCVGIPFLRPPIHHDPDLHGGYPVPSKAGTIALLERLDLPATTEPA